jgi:hypothetical protein
MISVVCLEWLRYRWFSICLFMAFDSTYCDIFTSLWAFSYTLSLCLLEMWITLVLSWSRSMYYSCSILYLASCAAWFVHRFVSQCFGYDPCGSVMVFISSICDFQLVGLYPCFEMSYPCDPHFSCYGWQVGFACDRWWLFLLLWLLCLGHRSLWFTLASRGVRSFALRNLVFWLLPSWVQNLMFVTHMAWFEGELMICLGLMGSW